MQIDLIDRLFSGEVLLLLALLPGFIATQLFIWQSGVRVREGQLERIAWSLGVGVVSAPVLLLAVPLLTLEAPIPRFVRLTGSVLVYGIVLLVASASGIALGQRYREEFHDRYDAHPSLETAWAFLHLRTPRGFAHVRTKSNEEFVGQVRFVGKALPNDELGSRDILLVEPRRLDVTTGSPATPYATRLGRFLHLTGGDIHHLSIDATLNDPPDTSVLAWLEDLLSGGDDDPVETANSEPAADPVGPSLTVTPDSPDVVDEDGTRTVTVTVTNEGDEPATAVEVHALFRDASGHAVGRAHEVSDEIAVGESEVFTIPFVGASKTRIRSAEVTTKIRPRIQLLATPMLSFEGGCTTAVTTVRNVSDRTVRYGEVIVRFYTANGDSVGVTRGYVENVSPGERATVHVPLCAPGAERATQCTYGVGGVFTR